MDRPNKIWMSILNREGISLRGKLGVLVFHKPKAVVSETALELVTIAVCRSEAIKIAFGLLHPPDQLLFF